MLARYASSMTDVGTLHWTRVTDSPDLVAPSVASRLDLVPSARVAEIDPALADTVAFCATYDILPERSANCVVVAGRRGGEVRYAAVVVLATMRADVNGVVRRELDVRKCSFALMDDAVARTGMEYGGITPVGLPPGWPVLVDDAVVDAGVVVLGSGLRRSKLLLPAAELLALPHARQLRLAG
jgi:prolyl-tRNA editing enzyme YbaK/EbsC (Cys-tRNA(Pro) deacylase)